MTFTVQDFQDLLRLLDEHPEWQAELRRRMLTDELLEVPALLRRMADAQARTDEQLVALTARVDALTARVDALTQRVDAIAEQLATLTARVDALTDRIDRLAVRVEANTGELLEIRYERRAPAYFSPMARRVRVLDWSTIADLLDDAVDDGRISEAERQDAVLADLVAAGQRRDGRADVYLVAEVSVDIGADDIRRAADRANILAKLGRPAIPVVAGERIDPDPAALARARGVWQVLNGHASPPEVTGAEPVA